MNFKEHFKRHNNIGQNNGQQQHGGGAKSVYICIVCRQELKSNSEYSTHMKHHLRRAGGQSPAHSTVKELARCSKCPIKFENGDDLAAHMVKCHPDEESTGAKVTVLKEEARLPNRSSKMDFLCEICSSKFETNVKLQAHLLLKHEHQNQQVGVSCKSYSICSFFSSPKQLALFLLRFMIHSALSHL